MIIYYRVHDYSPVKEYDTPATVEYGVQILEQALRERQIPVYLDWVDHCPFSPETLCICVRTRPQKGVSAESFAIRRENNRICLDGGGDAGTMYGLFELAEAVRYHGVEQIPEGNWSPFLEKRGVKFNLPFQTYAEGDPFIKNRETVKKFAFWRDYIDFLARNRYNCLSLWSENPFEMMLELSKYPEASGVPAEERRRNRELFTKILAHARARGIQTYMITWNVRISPGIAKGLGLPWELGARDWDPRSIGLRQHAEVIKDYFREAIKTMIYTFPDLTGLGTSNSEEMVGTAKEREQWVVDTYLAALKEVGYPIPFIHRTNMSNGPVAQEMFLSQCKDADTYISWKYSNAHMYSHPKPQFEKLMHAWDGQDMNDVQVLYTVRNDDFHNLRGCDPVFLAEYFKGMKKPWVKGFYWGADCYIWAGEFQHAPNSHLQWEHAYQKHWMQFVMLGRLGYDPELPETVWTDMFTWRYGENGQSVYNGLTAGVRILCGVNRLFWINYDFQWHPESLLSTTGFKTVADFMEGEPMPGVGVIGLQEYVTAKLAGKTPQGETPEDIFSLMEKQIAVLEDSIRSVESDPEAHAGELECILFDLMAWKALGRYYLCKFRAASDLLFYRQTAEEEYKRQAVALLEEGLSHWKELAEMGNRHYLPYTMPRVRKTFGWGLYTGEAARDIYLAKEMQFVK